jgi:predicted nucleotidyltransferase
VIAYLDRKYPRDARDLIYVLEHYESSSQGTRRFDALTDIGVMTYEISGAFLLGRDVQTYASPQASAVVKAFVKGIADETHSVLNEILRDENRLFSDERRQFAYKLIEAFRKGLN